MSESALQKRVRARASRAMGEAYHSDVFSVSKGELYDVRVEVSPSKEFHSGAFSAMYDAGFYPLQANLEEGWIEFRYVTPSEPAPPTEDY